jgi:hypothetical protein
VTVLDDRQRNTEVITIANALHDWIGQRRIGEIVMRTRLMDQAGLVLAWQIVAEYLQGKSGGPDETRTAEDFIRLAARRMLSDDRVRRRIAAFACQKYGYNRARAKACLQTYRLMLDHELDSPIVRPN